MSEYLPESVASSSRDNGDRRSRLDLLPTQLIWLFDDQIDCKTMTAMLEKLHRFVDDIKIFDNVDQCKEFLEQTTSKTTFLVLANQYEKSFISQISHMKHIWSIHIYCTNTNEQQRRRRTEFNRRIIHVDSDELLTDLSQTIQHESNCEENAFSTSDFAKEEDETTTDDSAWSTNIEFLDFLCYLPNPDNYLENFIIFLEDYYKGNATQLNKVKEFTTYYKPENAIYWYTEDTFVFCILNRALRRQNIQVLFFVAFLIKDISKQLKSYHEQFKQVHNTEENSIVKVYRGQLMSFNELQQLRNETTSPWIVNNSFFSATFDFDVATRFLNTSPQSKDELQSVLFEIEVNSQIKTRSYGDISQTSQFEDEMEFLFSFGNRFGKTKIYDDHEQNICIVQMQLNYDYYLKEDSEFLLGNSRKKFKKCINLLESLVEDMSMKSTNIVFNQLFNLYPAEKEWITAVELSWLASKDIQQNAYNSAIDKYKQALYIWQKFIDDEDLNCLIDIAHTHASLAYCYQYKIKDYLLANEHYLESLQYFKLSLKQDITIYERMKIYEKLTYLEKHRIQLPDYDPDDTEMIIRYENLSLINMLEYYQNDQIKLGQTLKQLGDLKKFQYEFIESLNHYQHALDIFIQQPFQFDFYLIILDLTNEIVKIYIEEMNNDYLSAIQYELIKHKYILKHFKPVSTFADKSYRITRCIHYCDLAQSHIDLAYKYMAIKKHKTAEKHLSKGLEFYNRADPTTTIDIESIKNSYLHEQLANLSLEVHDYENAYQYMKMAMKSYQNERYMLQMNLQIKILDSVMRIKHQRAMKKLESRGQILQNKMVDIQKLMANVNVQKKDS